MFFSLFERARLFMRILKAIFTGICGKGIQFDEYFKDKWYLEGPNC
jgi:hypothetical protein